MEPVVVVGEDGKINMSAGAVEGPCNANMTHQQSISFGPAETIALICGDYPYPLRKTDYCKDAFSYEVKNCPVPPPPSAQCSQIVRVATNNSTFLPRHFAMMFEKFVQIERLSMVQISSFMFLIEDLIVLSKEAVMENGVFLPEAWLQLSTFRLTKLSNTIMVQRGYINWKNFLIACMDVPFPSQIEILDALGQFRTLDPEITNCVDKNKFDLTTFWFEPVDAITIAQDPTPQLWRECIFQLFCDNLNRFQYIEFLLYFCKDVDSRVGLAKSLALLTGRIIPVDDLPELDRFLSDDLQLTVTDSELEILFSEEDLSFLGESDSNYRGFSNMGQKVGLTRRMTLLKQRRERLRHPQESEEEGESHEEEGFSPVTSPETEELPNSTHSQGSTDPNSHFTVDIMNIQVELENNNALEGYLGSHGKSPKHSFDKSYLEGHEEELSDHERGRHSHEFEDFSIEGSMSGEAEGIEMEDETEEEFDGEGEYAEEDGDNSLRSRSEQRRHSRKGSTKSEYASSTKHESKKGKGKKAKRSDSVGEGKLKKEGSRTEKPILAKKKGTKKGQVVKVAPVVEEKGKSVILGSDSLENSRSAPVDLLSDHELNEEDETEEEGEYYEEEGEQEEEMFSPESENLIPLEAFLQSLWFGHITAYPIRNQSFLSKGFEKLKELTESVYEEQYLNGGRDVVDAYSAKLSRIVQHPFIIEILKRYKGFEILDLKLTLQIVLSMPEEEDDFLRMLDTASIADSEPSVDLAPLPRSPILSESSFNSSFSEIFSCLSLNTRSSEASVKSGFLEAARASISPGELLPADTFSNDDEEELDDDAAAEAEEAELLDKTPTLGYSDLDIVADLKEESFADIILNNQDYRSPRSFGSNIESLEGAESNEDEGFFRLNDALGNSLRSVASWKISRNSFGQIDKIEKIISPPKIEPRVGLGCTSTEGLERKQHRGSQLKKSGQKYSPMAFGLEPNLRSLLW